MHNKWGGSSAILVRSCGDERTQIAISSYLDGEADSMERELAERHLADCVACRELMADWAQGAGQIRQNLQDRQLDWIARAIADQTRSFLARELPQMQQRGQPVGSLARSGLAVATPPNLRSGWLGVVMSGAVFVMALFGFSAMLMVAQPGLEPATPGGSSTPIEQTVKLGANTAGTYNLMPRTDISAGVTPSVNKQTANRANMSYSYPAPTPGLLKPQLAVPATPLVGRLATSNE